MKIKYKLKEFDRTMSGDPNSGQLDRGEAVGMEEDLLEVDEECLEEKKDRCYRLAKQKYDVFPSAYASGFIVRCRKGKVAKKKK
jgi:hypothetical protein